jgi:AcrR family transcriptional regulator
MELRDRLTVAALEAFEADGIRFTMDALAARLRVSKRTIYEQVGTKEDVIAAVINQAFESIKAQERAIIADPELDALTKLKRVLTVMPEPKALQDPRVISQVLEAYPAVYELIVEHLSTGWEATLALLDEATRQGFLRPVRPLLLREIILAAMEQMLQDDYLTVAGLSHEEALGEVIDILFVGLEIHR